MDRRLKGNVSRSTSETQRGRCALQAG